MDANSANSTNNAEQALGEPADLDVVSFPTLQEQTIFNVAISRHEEKSINTLNIRDYFFFSI